MSILMNSVARARDRSREIGLEFDLSLDGLMLMLAQQDYRCALTGVPFDQIKSETCTRKPFGPSVDRIDRAKGYTINNVRIVSQIANYARHAFSDEEFYKMCEAAARLRASSSENKIETQ